MINNQNTLIQSPVQQVQILKKKIETQNQKLQSAQQKIQQMTTKLNLLKQKNLQKRQKLQQMQQRVLQQKARFQNQQQLQSGQQSDYPQDYQSSIRQPGHSQSTVLGSSSDNAILNQLREHFRALRYQMMMGSSEEDDQESQYYDQVDVDNMTYEELLELGEKIGKVSKGLDMKKMESLKVKKYQPKNKEQAVECAICRDELQIDQDCIQLHCSHVFHDQCIKGWLNMQKHCPNCKRQIHTESQHSSNNSKQESKK